MTTIEIPQFEIRVPSSNGRSTYTVKRDRQGLSWYCSCPAWRFQHASPRQRSCKHIDAVAKELATQAVRGADARASR